jgi:aryl-alcohol dehydrogenase-like predicted oxidoreductase
MAEALETIAIAATNLNPTRIALGTWAIGGWMWGGTDEAESIRTIRSAVDRGINLIDTAPVYDFGHSEEIVGRVLEEIERRKVIGSRLMQSDGQPRYA